MKKIVMVLCLAGYSIAAFSQEKKPFLWGVATAAYQVEGNYKADGKGESKWDFLTNKVSVTQFVIGEKQTGNVAINMYDRTQYLKDIQLMKELGVNSYRFTLDWSRIIPDGIGEVNEKGLAHYDLLIDDLKAAGLEPIVTLYHFDYPFALMRKGGWANPEMINWYKKYASVVFERLGKKVKHWITFNEPYIEFFVMDYMANVEQSKEPNSVRFAKGMINTHHQLVASAETIKMYRAMKLDGKIGFTLNLSPCLPLDPSNQLDIKASKLQDKLLNTAFLDALFKGSYPQEALDSLQKYAPSFKPLETEMKLMAQNKPDFLGVNFYAPAYVNYDANVPMSCTWMGNNPDAVKSHNGAVRPEALYNLLVRIKNEYENPNVMITENGAGFPNEDIKEKPIVKDPLRADYIKRHAEAALKAKADGVKLMGYFPWSGWDNFEWVFGFSKRFGLIYVDFETQERIPKQSYYQYKKVIQENKQ